MKKISEKNDSALMSSDQSDIMNYEKKNAHREGSGKGGEYSPMSYTLRTGFKKLPHKKVPSTGKKLVAICASTGGPKAMQRVVPYLPGNLNAPMIMVQHMPQGFTRSYASRLNEKTELTVSEAIDGELLKNGSLYIAKGGEHLTVVQRRDGLHISFDNKPARSGLRPCADIMYESLESIDLDEIICVVLTGMGSDGTRGIGHLSEKKNVYVIAQDAESSTIDGMPGMVRKAGLADEVVPLDSIAEAIIRAIGAGVPVDGNGGAYGR